jgi:YD repeat-containing protein
LEHVTEMQRTATLSDANNPLSLLTLTDLVDFNGRRYTNVIDMVTKQRTTTSPEGRKLVTTFDAQGRIVNKQFGNLNPVSYTYDTRGRMATLTRGSGAQAREFSIAYNGQGYPATMLGPLSARVGLEYDAAGRVSRQILGDGRTITYAHDGAGNIVSITPPGRPSHLFSFSPVNLAKEYVAPDAGAGASTTALAFDQDRRLTSMTRPDGSSVTMSYDSAGRPATKTFPRGTIRYGYDPVTGVLSSLTAPDGGVLTTEYDGYLGESRDLGGPQSSLTRDELVVDRETAVVARHLGASHRERLKEPVHANGLRELTELTLVELAARLVGVWLDAVDLNPKDRITVHIARHGRKW